MGDHRLIDERSLAFGRAIAARLNEDPALIERARLTLAHWMETASERVKPDLLTWSAALNGPIDAVAQLLTSDDEDSARLRQSNPFAGVLSPHERSAILKRFREHDPAAT